MPITRRSFIGAAGAGAALSALPAGLAAGANAGLASSAAGSKGLYAIVSKHATWAVFDNLSLASREAALIRQSGAILANPVRCTPQLAQQFQAGNLASFVELDGWALTSREAKQRGHDLLQHARDRQAVKEQLLDHHFKQARRWLADHDDARMDGCYYRINRSDAEIVQCHENKGDFADSSQVFRCGEGLYKVLSAHTEDAQPVPQISKHTSFHLLQEEHEDRLSNDLIYRIAVAGKDRRREVIDLREQPSDWFVAIAQSSNWVFGAGRSAEHALDMAAVVEPYIDDELITERASSTLAHAVLDNGYEVPGFWKRVRGTLRHETEIPPPRSILAGVGSS